MVFTAVSYFKFAILKAEGVHWAPQVFALVKAAIAAKFISIGRAPRWQESAEQAPHVAGRFTKSLSFLVFAGIYNRRGDDRRIDPPTRLRPLASR